MNYNNPIQAGRDAFNAGTKRHECPADRRTLANTVAWWKQGWDLESKKNCNGFEVEPGVYSGCDKSGGDCPICGE